MSIVFTMPRFLLHRDAGVLLYPACFVVERKRIHFIHPGFGYLCTYNVGMENYTEIL